MTDPARIDRAGEFLIDRKASPHLGFGHGIHFCLGAPLARVELRAVTGELLRRLPDLTGTGEAAEYRWGAGNIMSIACVRVRFTPVEPDRKATVGA